MGGWGAGVGGRVVEWGGGRGVVCWCVCVWGGGGGGVGVGGGGGGGGAEGISGCVTVTDQNVSR